MKNRTAILIFANSAEKEANLKPFFSSDVFAILNKHTLKTVKKTRFSYYLFSEKEQIGNSFGCRFSNAIQTLFNKGYNNVITVGNDTPHLKTSHLLEAKNKLVVNDLVIGPSKDGGFYLLAIKKEYFDKKTFLKLPWQTNRLQKSIATLYKHQKIKRLELLSDIDKKDDIKIILNSFKAICSTLLSLLIKHIQCSKKLIKFVSLFIKETNYTSKLNKGPPGVFVQLNF